MSHQPEPKRLRRRLLSSWPSSALIRQGLRRRPPVHGELLVAMFHQVLDARRFASQLDAVLEDGTPVSGSEVVAAIQGGACLPTGAVWLTFDDAYGDFAESAIQVLEERGLRATQFVPTSFVGANPASFWWERLSAAFAQTALRSTVHLDYEGGALAVSLRTPGARGKAYKLARGHVKRTEHGAAMELVERWIQKLGAEPRVTTRVLSWEELAALESRGVEVGGHTRTHPMLDRVDREVAQSEIQGGFDDLQLRLGRPLPAFAYPSGQFNPGVVDALRALGIPAAVTTVEGTYRLGVDSPLEIPRVAIGPHADEWAVRARVLLARRRRPARTAQG